MGQCCNIKAIPQAVMEKFHSLEVIKNWEVNYKIAAKKCLTFIFYLFNLKPCNDLTISNSFCKIHINFAWRHDG